MSDLGKKIKEMIISRLNLQIKPDDIDAEARLFGEGLGLDSIDALELVVAVEEEFGISITDQETGQKALYSVKTLSDFINNGGNI